MTTSKKLMGRAIFLAHSEDRKKTWRRMRWPSAPDANKTRPHLGLFLHIRP
jgi:hypothetical protein